MEDLSQSAFFSIPGRSDMSLLNSSHYFSKYRQAVCDRKL